MATLRTDANRDPEYAPGAAPVILEKPVNHLDEIEGLVDELSRASPSATETIAAQIKAHLKALRGGADTVFATKHESLVADDQPPIPVAPAAPQDMDEAERERQTAKLQAKLQAERDQADRERAAADTQPNPAA